MRRRYWQRKCSMCLAIPMRITQISGRAAVVELDGITRNIRVDLLDSAGLGDYVLVHAGVAIAVVDEAEALETLSLLRGLSDEVR